MKQSIKIGVMLIGLSLSLFTATASATGKNDKFLNRGVGAYSCGKFIAKVDKYKLKNRGWPELVHHVEYSNYMLGYVTAYNLLTPNTYDILGSTDFQGAIAFLEKYCRDNPLKDYLDAIRELTYELYPHRKQEAD